MFVYILKFKKNINILEPSGYYTYRTVVSKLTTRFYSQKFRFLSTRCIYVFCVDLRTNSDYFPIQH